MRRNEVLRALVSGGLIYVVMAACSASSDGGGPVAGTGQDAGQLDGATGADGSGDGAGGAPDAMGDALADGSKDSSILDALTDPVPDALADVTTSGSRLKAKWIVGADGSKQFRNWYDSQLGHDCYFNPASDGQTRCLPYGNVACSARSTRDRSLQSPERIRSERWVHRCRKTSSSQAWPPRGTTQGSQHATAL